MFQSHFNFRLDLIQAFLLATSTHGLLNYSKFYDFARQNQVLGLVELEVIPRFESSGFQSSPSMV